MQIPIDSKSTWADTGVLLEAGSTWRLSVTGRWRDASIDTDAAGYESVNFFQRRIKTRSNDQDIELGLSFQHLERNRALPGDNERVVVRVDERQAFARCEFACVAR